VRQFDLNAARACGVTSSELAVDAERDEQGRLLRRKASSGGESALSVVERGARDACPRAELTDRQTAGGVPPEAFAPETLELGIFGSCHPRSGGERGEKSPCCPVQTTGSATICIERAIFEIGSCSVILDPAVGGRQ
jgi:hypothetical protein